MTLLTEIIKDMYPKIHDNTVYNLTLYYVYENYGNLPYERKKNNDHYDIYVNDEDIDKVKHKLDEIYRFYIMDIGYMDKIHEEIELHRKNMPDTCAFLEKYCDEKSKRYKNNSSLCDVIYRILSENKELNEMTEADIAHIARSVANKTALDEAVRIFQQFRELHPDSQYGVPSVVEKEPTRHYTAYDKDTILSLAYCVFNEDHIRENDMLNKALDSVNLAYIWVYVAYHYICGWRMSDICKRVVYIDLQRDPLFLKSLPRDPDKLRNMIVNDEIADDIYKKVADYAAVYTDAAMHVPGKTADKNPVKVHIKMSHDLMASFGRLYLIIAYHVLLGAEKMKATKMTVYCRSANLEHFFGKKIAQALKNGSFVNRKFTKSFLQADEKNARLLGADILTAPQVAAYARAHKQLRTTSIYTEDGNYTGETAEYIAYQMMDRPIFGAIQYQLLSLIMPDKFHLLNAEEQTRLMNQINMNAYKIELISSFELVSGDLKDAMVSSDLDNAVKKDKINSIIKALFAISTLAVPGKSDGVICLRKAFGGACDKSTWEDCIKNACKYCIFTRDGINTLMSVLKQYRNSDDAKDLAILQQVLIPVFHESLESALADANDEQKLTIKKYIALENRREEGDNNDQ